MGLRAKLSVVLVVGVVLPAILLAGSAYYYFYQHVAQGAAAKQQLRSERWLQSATRDFADVVDIARHLTLRQEVRDFLRASRLQQYRSKAELVDLLSAYVQSSALVEGAAIVDAQGRRQAFFPQTAGDGYKLNRLAIPPASRSLKPQPVLQSQDGVVYLWFSLADLESSRDNTVLGYVRLSLLAKRLASDFKQLADDFTELLLFGDQDRVVLSPADMSPFVADFEARLPQFFSAGDAQITRQLRVANSHFLLTAVKLSPTVTVATVSDLSAVSREQLGLPARLLALVVCGLAIFTLLLFWYLQGYLLVPISRLAALVDNRLKGKQQKLFQLDRSDELGRLNHALNRTMQNLQYYRNKVAHLANYDSLTGLPNRFSLHRSLNQAIKAAEGTKYKLAILCINLDDFKKINDRFGYHAGDQLLRMVAERLIRSYRDIHGGESQFSVEELVSHHGADEYYVVLERVKSVSAVATAVERIEVDLSLPFELANDEVQIGTSTGVAIYPNDGEDADTLLHNADMAMHRAKRDGKNTYRLFSPQFDASVHARMELEQDLKKALQNNEFFLCYQPKVELNTLDVIGLECLVRWRSPKRGLVSPADFVPVAEESHLIMDLGNWILAETLFQIKQWEPHLPADFRIAVNISPRQLEHPSFAEDLIDLCRELDVSTRRVKVEFTESCVLNNESLVQAHIAKLQAREIHISLDDFGTGFSSLNLLHNLAVDEVKIDQSFVKKMVQDKGSYAIVCAVLGLCRQLSIKTVAEGITSIEQLAILAENDCMVGQGYWFSKPLPADKILDFIANPPFREPDV